MIRQLGIFCTTILFGALVLLVSVHAATTPMNELRQERVGYIEQIKLSNVDYSFPEIGMIRPDSALWPVKALADRIPVVFAWSDSSRAQLMLSRSDERLVQSNYLLSVGEYEHAALVLRRAEMYLEGAYNNYLSAIWKGEETGDLSRRILAVSRVHSKSIEDSLMKYPDETRPDVIETMNYSRRIFGIMSNKLKEDGGRFVSWI